MGGSRSTLSSPYQTHICRKAREGLRFISNRFPHRREIIAVLGVSVFVCYSWSIVGFLNKLSSFILYFTPAEIAEIFAFMMSAELLESVALTGFLVILSALLPSDWLRNGFALNGFVSIAVLTITSILAQKYLTDYPSIPILMLIVLLPLAVTVLTLFLARSVPKLQNILLSIADRTLIMLFVYLPLGLLCLIAVLYRNFS